MDREYEASLKSIETENVLDRIFYRRVGFLGAKALRGTPVTPNTVTVISIFVGVAGGVLFFPADIRLNIIGIACLVVANILDCVDGQLARMTGIKSAFGRILDGLAGDFWFLAIYVSLALRLYGETGSRIFMAIAVLSALSHLFQANITDYYKTLHLYFISKEKGAEFRTAAEVEAAHAGQRMGVGKAMFFLYRWYTMFQISATPQLQALLLRLGACYGDDIPGDIRLQFRKKSARLMKLWVDWLTFNGRTVVLFAVVLSGEVWAYFVFEIVVLNVILFIARNRHEKM
ncbi:MAG: CDP-alcohol phosphatidyltransferase family protein, partial [Tannerellaceae bacterium]|nr:CDP-alcohol phosphatidyltransferase family protein [Tannerellaceae bacterium]